MEENGLLNVFVFMLNGTLQKEHSVLNSFIMAVYEEIFSRTLDRKICLNFKHFQRTTIVKLFGDQSELSALPAG